MTPNQLADQLRAAGFAPSAVRIVERGKYAEVRLKCGMYVAYYPGLAAEDWPFCVLRDGEDEGEGDGSSCHTLAEVVRVLSGTWSADACEHGLPPTEHCRICDGAA